MRLLGIDFGFKRIGVATVDSLVGLPSPRTALAASGALKKDAAAIDALGKKELAEAIVIGLPVEPDGQEGRMARICRQLAEHLNSLNWKVHLVDESLSSVQAEQTLLLQDDLKASQRKKRRDGEAACLILERYLAEGPVSG